MLIETLTALGAEALRASLQHFDPGLCRCGVTQPLSASRSLWSGASRSGLLGLHPPHLRMGRQWLLEHDPSTTAAMRPCCCTSVGARAEK